MVADGGRSVMIAVIDVLGHGPEAAAVADIARTTVANTAHATEGGPPAESTVGCLQACHAALRRTRGAAVTAAAVTAAGDELAWLGVGNVEAAVADRRTRALRPLLRSVMLRGGVVGAHLPPLHPSSQPLAGGETLVLATDGIAGTFRDDIDPSVAPEPLVARLHDAHSDRDDDALVLVARVDP